VEETRARTPKTLLATVSWWIVSLVVVAWVAWELPGLIVLVLVVIAALWWSEKKKAARIGKARRW